MASRKTAAADTSPSHEEEGSAGPIPPGNEPGHHPAVEQDKPLGRRPRPRTVIAQELEQEAVQMADLDADIDEGDDVSTADELRTSEAGDAAEAGERRSERFAFRFAGLAGLVARGIVFDRRRAYVEVTGHDMIARYGPWVVSTPLSNIAEVSITGPYALRKVAGPAHLSLSDHGITFATTTERGVCITFHEPVAGIEPTGRIRHPNLTVTVADPAALLAALAG